MRLYLLGELTEEEERQVELRLMSDAAYVEESEIIEEEIIEQYINGTLSREESNRIKQHFFKSSQRQSKLRFALALKQQEPGSVQSRLQSRGFLSIYLPIAASILLILGLSFGIWRAYFYQSDVDKGIASLQTAFKDGRPVEARITDFRYAPAIIQRGGQDTVDYLSRDHAASLLLKAATESPNAQSHHALGKFYLAERQFSKAIDQFKAALDLNPQSAQIHSDLGATLLEQGKLHVLETEGGQGVEEFARSLTYLNKALELDPALLEALFNRALLYQHMQLTRQAEENWRAYLEKDPNSKWAQEARQHLKLLEEQKKKSTQTNEEIFQDFLRASGREDDETSWKIVSSYHNRTGNVVVERLLDALLEMSAAGQKDKASEHLTLLSYIGRLENQRTGGRFFTDLAKFYQSAALQPQPLLLQARQLMKSGYDGWGRVKVEETLKSFSKAKQIFNETGDVCEASVAEYWIGFCYYRDYRLNESLSTLEVLERQCEEKRYGWLRARALYAGALVQFDANEYSKAIQYVDSSLKEAEKIGDSVGMLNALSALTEYHRYVGDYHDALSYVQRSMPLVVSISLDPLQGCRHYSFAAAAFASLNLYAAAAEFQQEAVLLAQSANNPTAMSVNYSFLGVLYGKLQNYSEGIRNISKASEIASARSSEAAGQEMMAYSSLLMGDLQRQAGDFVSSVASYDRAITIYGSLNLPSFLYQAHKGRLLCYVAQKNDALAQNEIEAALNLVEKHRVKIFEEDYRNKFFDVEQSVYDQAANFAYSRMHDSDKAFDYSESSRARSLLDLIYSDSGLSQPQQLLSVSQPLKLSEIQQRLPEQVQVLQYAVLEDKVLIWLISRAGVSPGIKEISQEDLSAKIRSYLQLSSNPSGSGDGNSLRQAKELYDILIRPVASSLDRGKQLCIVPDKILNYLPFGALISPVTGKYLIEDYSLLISPSSTVLIACSEMAEKKVLTKGERLLSVGNPSFDRRNYPLLPDLPSAAREATEVASLYDSPLLLIGGRARENEIRKELDQSEVLHFALHTVLNERFPTRSKLLLATEPPVIKGDIPEGSLPASDIYNLKLPGARLVVLSACQTGAEQYYRGEGMLSMARPFISAGVPLVTASLWAVDSDATANLMISFHKHRKRGNLSTVESLRRAQLEMLSSPEERLRQPYYWASFIVIGGYAEF